MSSGSTGSTASAAAPDSPDPLMDFNGIWRGRSVSTMNAASAKITFSVKREGNQIKGDYRCAPGNAICRNNVQRGWVTGQVSARGFRVEMEDSSWCVYFMDEFYPPKARGEYTCYMNGGIADQGTFRLKGPPVPANEGAPVKPQT
ncbi:MAG TPA: hypothetical protein VNF49_12605 [Candidatus Binataceae bacterium]|nr:hypothetical protein [Candidatus Binataceae bacterium]